jgi:uncharacterized protein
MIVRESGPSERCSEPAPPALLKGIEEFNRGLFFEQHETLEDAWIEESDSVRYLYQGILQVGVAFHHLRRGNLRGATGLLERGLGYLRPFVPSCMGVDVERLVTDASAALIEIQALVAGQIDRFDMRLIPRVHLLSGTEESDRD